MLINERQGLLLGISAVILFSLTLPITRLIVADFDPWFIGPGRAVLAALLACILLMLWRRPFPDRRQLLQLIITAAGVVVGFPLLTAWAMQTVHASHGGIMLGLLPLMTALVGVFIAHERPSLGFWLAALIGSVLVVGFALIKGRGHFQSGDLALFGAILSAAIGYAVGGRLSRHMPGWWVICWALLIALPFTFWSALSSFPPNALEIGMLRWSGYVYLALISQLFGFFLWYRGLAIGGIARVSQTQLLQPFFTLGFSALLLSEWIDLTSILFALLVVSVVTIGKRMPVRHTTPVASADRQ
jgi:drug/metabolite transporter (DMT)-like permease